MRVLAAMSGGVDSAVAAARAVDAGHEVTGVHLALAQDSRSRHRGSRGCCSLEDARDARRSADIIGIPFYVWDLAERFREEVVDDFLDEYARGRTPNPCLRCNERIKFAAVLDRARALGFDAVCTGHYARLVDGPHGRELHRAADPDKDQSYVLAVLDSGQLDGAMLPLGDSAKADVRAEAERRGLMVADKPDSHDICFIPGGDTAAWLRDRLGPAPADIVDAVTEEVVGRTETAYALTVGQRRGLALARPAPDGQPRYVVDVDLNASRVTVGPRGLTEVDVVEGRQVRWCGAASDPVIEGTAQVRAHGEPVPATGTVDGGTLTVRLASPVAGVAQGQAIVMYAGTRAVLSATITGTRRHGLG